MVWWFVRGVGNLEAAPQAVKQQAREAAQRAQLQTLGGFLNAKYVPWVLAERKSGVATLARLRHNFADLLERPMHVAEDPAAFSRPLSSGDLLPILKARHHGRSYEEIVRTTKHQAQHGANTRDSPSQRQRGSVRLLGRPEEGELHVAKQVVVVPKQGQSHRDALLHRRIGEACRDATAVGFLGQLPAHLGQGGLAVGVLDMRQQLGAVAQAVHPAPEERACRPHRSGRDLRLREPPPAQEPGNFLGLEWVIFGFAAMHGLHGEGRPEDAGNALPRTQVGQPVPREETFDRDDHVITRRRNDREEGLGAGRAMLVDHDLPSVVQYTDVHGASVPVDPTIRFVLLRVAWHEGSSS